MRPVLKYNGSGQVLDRDLEDIITSADLLGDAEEVIWCLYESPRWQKHRRRVLKASLKSAEESREQILKEIEELEALAK